MILFFCYTNPIAMPAYKVKHSKISNIFITRPCRRRDKWIVRHPDMQDILYSILDKWQLLEYG